MRRFLSVLILISLFITMATMLSGCKHECTFAEEWTKDETSHWHVCTGKSCEEISDKADHTWDEGTISTPATQEADGEKVFTCTVCSQTKTESVEFTGLTKEEWDEIINKDLLENVTCTDESVVTTEGIEVKTKTVYKFEKDRAYAEVSVAGQSDSMTATGKDLEEVRDSMWKSIKPLVKFENLKYDAESKSYVLNEKKQVTVPTLKARAKTLTVKLIDNKLAKVSFTCDLEESGISFEASVTATFTDYGSTTASASGSTENV